MICLFISICLFGAVAVTGWLSNNVLAALLLGLLIGSLGLGIVLGAGTKRFTLRHGFIVFISVSIQIGLLIALMRNAFHPLPILLGMLMLTIYPILWCVGSPPPESENPQSKL